MIQSGYCYKKGEIEAKEFQGAFPDGWYDNKYLAYWGADKKDRPKLSDEKQALYDQWKPADLGKDAA